jgi:hypothetical protein
VSGAVPVRRPAEKVPVLRRHRAAGGSRDVAKAPTWSTRADAILVSLHGPRRRIGKLLS